MTHLAMDCSVRELCDAVVGGVGYGPAFGVCDAGGTAWSESALCRRFGISRKTGYKWLSRARSGPWICRTFRGGHGRVRGARRRGWRLRFWRCDRTIRAGVDARYRRLADLGETDVPAPSTVTAILRRHGVALGQAGNLPALRALAAERAVADGLQRPFCLGPGPLPSVDRAGRLLALQPVPGGLRQRAGRDGAGASGQHSVAMACRSGSSSTTARPGAMDRTRRTRRSASGCCASASASVTAVPIILRRWARTSASTDAEGRTAGRSALRRSRALPAGLWRIVYNWERPHQALDLDVPAARFRPSPRPFPEALPPIETRPTSGPPRPGQRPHQLQGQDLQTAQGVRRIPGRTGANHSGRNMEGDLRKPPDRATRHARWHSQNCYPCLRTPVTLVPGPYPFKGEEEHLVGIGDVEIVSFGELKVP